MKTRLFSLGLILACITLFSCKNSRDVMGDFSVQKRKYSRGWYVESSGRINKELKSEKVENPVVQTRKDGNEKSVFDVIDPDDHEVESAEVENSIYPRSVQSIPTPTLRENLKHVDYSAEIQYSPEAKKKKKKSKAAVIPIIDWGAFSGSLSTWFWGWETIPFLNIPVLGIILGVIAITLCFIGFFKLKKIKRKGRNIMVAVFGIVFGLLSLLVCIALL